MAHFVNFKWQPNNFQSTQNLEKISHFTNTTYQTNIPSICKPFRDVINQPKFTKQQNPQVYIVEKQQLLPSKQQLVKNLLLQSNINELDENVQEEYQQGQIQYNSYTQSELEQSIVEQLYDPLVNQGDDQLEEDSILEPSYVFTQSSDIYASQKEQQEFQNKQAFEQMQKVFFEELNKMEKQERDNIVETLLKLEENQMHDFIVYLMDQKNNQKSSDKIRSSIVYARELQQKQQKKQFEIQNFETLKYQGKKQKNLQTFNFQIVQPSQTNKKPEVPRLSKLLMQNFSQLFSSNLNNQNGFFTK